MSNLELAAQVAVILWVTHASRAPSSRRQPGEEERAERARMVPLASGTEVEIGVGSGLNLAYHGPRVERLYALDPSAPRLRMAKRRVAPPAMAVEWIEEQAEPIPLGQGVADTAAVPGP
jgi:ubiquinone/menaquinone biosynthesis C-methylase UbiE